MKKKRDCIPVIDEGENKLLLRERNVKTKSLQYHMYTKQSTPKKFYHTTSPFIALKKHKGTKTIKEKSKDFDLCR